MTFRRLALISLCVFLTQTVYAQGVEPTPELHPEVIQPLTELSLEEQLQILLDTIKTVETDRATLDRQLKRTTDGQVAQQIKMQRESLQQRHVRPGCPRRARVQLATGSRGGGSSPAG